MPAETYPHLDFGREELAAAIRATYDDLIAFAATPSFATIRRELASLPPRDRPAFVSEVLLRPEELAKRGLTVPDGILIETSAFGDRRPTLFALKKYLPERFHAVWENVNLTFDNEYDDASVSRDPEVAWRPPLPVGLQNEAIAKGINLETFPTERGIEYAPPAAASNGAQRPGR